MRLTVSAITWRMKKLLSAIFGLMLVAAPASVQAANPVFLYFTNSGNTITITNYTGPGIVAVPSTITGLNVTNAHLLTDNSLTFGGFHYNSPREIYAEFRYRFHY